MKTVLVIDDEEKICWAFEQFLAEEGYRPLVAQNAEEGLRQIEKENPDVVFLDVCLPGMDGLDALKQIRARNFKIAVILITAYPSAQVTIEARKLSVYDCLTKPIDLDEAKRVLEDAINAQEVSRKQISSGETIFLCSRARTIQGNWGRLKLTRRVSFSFLLSIVIHLIAALIAALFVITTSEKLSDYVQIEWLRISQPKPKQRRMRRKRIITKLQAPPVQRTLDMLPQKSPPVWTAVSLETYHQGESVFLPPMPSRWNRDSPFIPSSRVDFREAKKTPTLIKSQKALSLSRIKPKREGLLELSSMLEYMTPRTAEPVLQDALSPYLRKVRQKIERVKKYPSVARRLGVEGTVHVKFTILSNGKVEGVEVARSSGHKTLDKAAVLAIKNATPFPPFPKTIRRESLRIELPLAFKLLEPE